MKKLEAILTLIVLCLAPFGFITAQPVTELKDTGLSVILREFNPGKNDEWDGELEFNIRYDVSIYDPVARVWTRSNIGRGTEFVIAEGKIDEKNHSFIIYGRELLPHFPAKEMIDGKRKFSLTLEDVNFFGDVDLIQNDFELGLLPFTKSVQARLVDFPRAGRDQPTFTEVVLLLRRKAGVELLEKLVPSNSIRFKAEQRWAGENQDYVLYSLRMAALYEALKAFELDASMVIEDKKALERLDKLFELLDQATLDQQRAECLRKAQRLKSFGLGLTQIAKFFGLINPEDAPSAAETMVDKVKLLARAEYYGFQSSRAYSKSAEAARDLKERLLDLEKPGLTDQAKILYEKSKEKAASLGGKLKSKLQRQEKELLPEPDSTSEDSADRNGR